MLRALRRAADGWLFQLGAADSGTVRLTMRRVFIVPSSAGLGFAGLLLAMLVAALNYKLGLGFALTFLCACCALADMVLTARNLAGLRLTPGRAAPVFAGEAAQFELQLANPAGPDRYALWLAFQSDPLPRQVTDVAAGASASVVLSAPAGARGWLAAPRVLLVTRFPLGLFRAWSYWRPDLRVLVYPAPEADGPPLPVQGGAGAGGPRHSEPEQFSGIRPYLPGDPRRQLAWRQMARHDPADGGPLLSKQFDSGAGAELTLDFDALPAALATEDRLARLCRWVLLAEQAGLPYRLQLGGAGLGPALGPAQRAACLQALALYGLERQP